MPVEIPASAGKPYRPSNGTEGDMFAAKFCARCTNGADEENPCMIFGNALFNDIGDPDYPSEWTYDPKGHPKCSAFVWRGPAVTPNEGVVLDWLKSVEGDQENGTATAQGDKATGAKD